MNNKVITWIVILFIILFWIVMFLVGIQACTIIQVDAYGDVDIKTKSDIESEVETKKTPAD